MRLPEWTNARLQAPPRAKARHERRLLAVACKPLLGCWGPTQVPRRPSDRPPLPMGAPPWPPHAATAGGPWAMAPATRQGQGGKARGTTAPCTTDRARDASPCWPAAAGPWSALPREGRHANPPRAQQETPRAHAETVSWLTVTRRWPHTCASAPARASVRHHARRCGVRGHRHGPGSLQGPGPHPPAPTEPPVSTGGSTPAC